MASSFDAVVAMEEGRNSYSCDEPSIMSICFAKKVLAEFIGTFFLIFTGCASNMINAESEGSLGHGGVSLAWGAAAMVIIYSVGHISGAHLNPAVTAAFAATRRFPILHLPIYVVAQCAAAIVASFQLRIMFGKVAYVGATIPAGSDFQCFIFEMNTTFLLMFVISAVATDTRAIGELAGLAIGSTITLDVLISGPVTGASMNPARSLGPAIAGNVYTSIWLYLSAPMLGAMMGAFTYDTVRLRDKAPLPLAQPQTNGGYVKVNSVFRRSSSVHS